MRMGASRLSSTFLLILSNYWVSWFMQHCCSISVSDSPDAVNFSTLIPSFEDDLWRRFKTWAGTVLPGESNSYQVVLTVDTNLLWRQNCEECHWNFTSGTTHTPVCQWWNPTSPPCRAGFPSTQRCQVHLDEFYHNGLEWVYNFPSNKCTHPDQP